jgi:hypothetical protein
MGVSDQAMSPQALLIGWAGLVVSVAGLIVLTIYMIKTWEIASASLKQAQSAEAMVRQMRGDRVRAYQPHLALSVGHQGDKGVHSGRRAHEWLVSVSNHGRGPACGLEYRPDLPSRPLWEWCPQRQIDLTLPADGKPKPLGDLRALVPPDESVDAHATITVEFRDALGIPWRHQGVHGLHVVPGTPQLSLKSEATVCQDPRVAQLLESSEE